MARKGYTLEKNQRKHSGRRHNRATTQGSEELTRSDGKNEGFSGWYACAAIPALIENWALGHRPTASEHAGSSGSKHQDGVREGKADLTAISLSIKTFTVIPKSTPLSSESTLSSKKNGQVKTPSSKVLLYCCGRTFNPGNELYAF